MFWGLSHRMQSFSFLIYMCEYICMEISTHELTPEENKPPDKHKAWVCVWVYYFFHLESKEASLQNFLINLFKELNWCITTQQYNLHGIKKMELLSSLHWQQPAERVTRSQSLMVIFITLKHVLLFKSHSCCWVS